MNNLLDTSGREPEDEISERGTAYQGQGMRRQDPVDRPCIDQEV